MAAIAFFHHTTKRSFHIISPPGTLAPKSSKSKSKSIGDNQNNSKANGGQKKSGKNKGPQPLPKIESPPLPLGLKFIDIGLNLCDDMYSGIYNGKTAHQPDLDAVLNRAWASGVTKAIITAGNLTEAKAAIALARKHPGKLYATVGVHPTRAFECAEDLKGLKEVIEGARDVVVAVGECGLDYDRLQFAPKEAQAVAFASQLDLAADVNLPLFLHCRAAADDLIGALRPMMGKLSRKGVVHTWDGALSDALVLVNELGMSLGLNGCSLKTEENAACVAKLPVHSLMLETDAPWCGIRPTHAGAKWMSPLSKRWNEVKKERYTGDLSTMVKGRNEPCTMIQVAEVVCGMRSGSETLSELVSITTSNAENMFWGSSS